MAGKPADLKGQIFGKLEVIRFSHVDKNKQGYWIAVCSCDGKEVLVKANCLKQGKTRSCGCLYKEKASKMFPDRAYGKAINFIDLVGKLFGNWLVLSFGGYDKNNHLMWKCECQCPKHTVKLIRTDALNSRKTEGCRCVTIKKILAKPSHGLSSRKDPIKHKFYRSYINMLSRCYCVNDISYLNYGGRGITVCNRWLGEEGLKHYEEDKYDSFTQHIQNFGLENTSHERLEVDGNYTPENTKWATLLEQGKNRQLSPVTKDLKLWKEVRKVAAAIRAAIVRNSKYSIYEPLLGCPIQEARKHIESQFIENMSWETYGYGNDKWEFDHIDSLRLFDFSKEDSWLSAFHFTNYRPFRRSQNASKC